MLKFAEHFVFIAAAMDRIGDNQDELWDEEDGFFYDVLRLPDGQRPAAQGPLDGRPAPAVRHDAAAARAATQVSEDLLARLRRRIEAMPELLATIHDARVPWRQRAADAGRASTRRSCAGSSPGCSTRTSSCSPHGLRALSRYHADHPFRFDVHGQTYEVRLPARRVRHRDVRRQLELAGTGVVPGQLPRPARAAAPVRLLRRRLQGRVPDRLGTASARCSRWPASSAAGLASIFVPGEDGRRPVYGGTERVPDRSALEGPAAVLRVLPRRQRRRPRRQPPDRLDRPRRPHHPGARLPPARGPAVDGAAAATSSTESRPTDERLVGRPTR